MGKKRVFITHGYQSNPTRNWFEWLKEKLEDQDIEVVIPSLPHPDHPVREDWLDCLDKNVGTIDEDTFFVAHSLGCVTTLFFLGEQKEKAGGLILVAGFSEKLTVIPELELYTSAPVNFEQVKNIIPQITVFASEQDYIVPFELTKRMAENLEAKLISMPDSGHFMQEDGFNTFPALLAELEMMMGL